MKRIISAVLLLAMLFSLTACGKKNGEPAPDFTLETLSGESFTLSEKAGKVCLINFWATWCEACVEELPAFDKIYNTYGDKLEVLAIHSNNITDDVSAYLSDFDYTIAFAIDTDGSVIKSYGGGSVYPMTVIVDKDGNIAYSKLGAVTYEELEAQLSKLIK